MMAGHRCDICLERIPYLHFEWRCSDNCPRRAASIAQLGANAIWPGRASVDAHTIAQGWAPCGACAERLSQHYVVGCLEEQVVPLRRPDTQRTFVMVMGLGQQSGRITEAVTSGFILGLVHPDRAHALPLTSSSVRVLNRAHLGRAIDNIREDETSSVIMELRHDKTERATTVHFLACAMPSHEALLANWLPLPTCVGRGGSARLDVRLASLDHVVLAFAPDQVAVDSGRIVVQKQIERLAAILPDSRTLQELQKAGHGRPQISVVMRDARRGTAPSFVDSLGQEMMTPRHPRWNTLAREQVKMLLDAYVLSALDVQKLLQPLERNYGRSQSLMLLDEVSEANVFAGLSLWLDAVLPRG